jgi:IS4 transposase
VKAYLPKTSSKDYRARLFNFTFAALLYNLWRLTDFLVKVGMDREIRSPPVVTARPFVRAVGQSLRENDNHVTVWDSYSLAASPGLAC